MATGVVPSHKMVGAHPCTVITLPHGLHGAERYPAYFHLPVKQDERPSWQQGSLATREALMCFGLHVPRYEDRTTHCLGWKPVYQPASCPELACSEGARLSRVHSLSCVQEVAASYSFGAVGSLVYLRLLNRSVDSVGGFSVGAALGQPRLLIPIILTAAYNRQACVIDCFLSKALCPDKLAPYSAPVS